MWYVLRFFSDANDFSNLEGVVLSVGASTEEAVEDAKAHLAIPPGTPFGLPYYGDPPPELQYRVFTASDPEMLTIINNGPPAQAVSQWFWIRFVDENGNENGVVLSNGVSVDEALERAKAHTSLPAGEVCAYTYPMEPPANVRYRVLSQEDLMQLSGGYAPMPLGGWVSAMMQKTQDHDISKLPNADVLQKLKDIINRFGR